MRIWGRGEYGGVLEKFNERTSSVLAEGYVEIQVMGMTFTRKALMV